MKKFIRSFFLLLFITGTFNSCIDLAQVNTFSATAVETLQTFTGIKYSFSSSYRDYTAGEKLYMYTDAEFDNNRFGLQELQFDPAQVALNKKADATITYFVNTLTAYFQGLSAISDKDFVNYEYDTVANALEADSLLMTKLHISATQIDAGASIAKTFTNEILGHYREKKLREILIQKDAAVSTASLALISCLQNLEGNLMSDEGILQANFAKILAQEPRKDSTSKNVRDVSASFQKLKLKKEYYQLLAELKNENAQIDLLITGVHTIKDGHNKVVADVKNSKLNKGEIVAILKNYATKVHDIYQQIKALQ